MLIVAPANAYVKQDAEACVGMRVVLRRIAGGHCTVFAHLGTVLACDQAKHGGWLCTARVVTRAYRRVVDTSVPTFDVHAAESTGVPELVLVSGVRRSGRVSVTEMFDVEAARTLCRTVYAAEMEEAARGLCDTLDASTRAALPGVVWARVVLALSKFRRDLAHRPACERGAWEQLGAECEGEWEAGVCAAWSEGA